MNAETALLLADQLIYAKTGKSLNDLQRILFRGAWQGKSFTEIHQECSDRCGLDHLMRNVGPELWRLLSDALGTRVTKNNLQGPLEQIFRQQQSQLTLEPLTVPPESTPIMTSDRYVERSPFEAECDREIIKPGALIRIKAPQDMGKTWLMERVLAHARIQGYQTQTFSFELSDRTVFTDLERFSKWFCASIGQTLKLPNQLVDYWQDIFACNYNSTIYFENYLLAELTKPLVLALDKVDLVFEHPEIANDFCSLLRGWNQRATQGDDIGKIWKNLRLLVVHSTEVYGSLDINRSPLGSVGLVVKLPEFNATQVQELAQKYQLDWNQAEVEQLMAMVGGHPALVQQAFAQIADHHLTLNQLLKTAPTEAGSYGDHLRRHLGYLHQQPMLARAFKQVVTSAEPIQLEPILAFKLESLGLVHLQGNEVIPRCNLYRQYFRVRLEPV